MFDQETIDRFWSRVNREAGPDGCWYRGSIERLPDSYGTFSCRNSVYQAHVVAYQITYGSVPFELFVRHLCGHKGCCNPKHLAVGTQQENCLDTKFHQKHGRGVLAPVRYE